MGRNRENSSPKGKRNGILGLQHGELRLALPNQTALTQGIDTSFNLAWIAAQAADDRKGGDICILKVTAVSYLTDYLVIITGLSKTQVRAIAQGIKDATAEQCQRSPVHSEGEGDASWILLDYGDVMIHVQLPKERQFYNLEAFWGHAERIPFEQESL